MKINVEYKNTQGEYPIFFEKIQGKSVSVLYDVNTAPYALALIEKIQTLASKIVKISFSDEQLVPDERVCAETEKKGKGTDYLLAVGSGSLNDVAKFISTILGIPCGVLATAASMDGYCSKGSAVMKNGFKITEEVHTPSDILIDLDIIRNAPKLMTASGFGDIIGKYTCLTDWKMAHIVKGEPINVKAFTMMEQARTACMNAFDQLTRYDSEAIAKLMDALIAAGLSMAECGNSRPASGSEHHISHFLEMDFVRRGEAVPLHGIKVAIGTLISIELYNYIKDNQISFAGAEEVYALARELPSVERIKEMLTAMGCPVRFSEIGVRREVMEEMIEKAYTVRERYTVLTLVHDLGLTEQVKPILMKKFF